MNIVVFVGPTLPRELAEASLKATYLPPAAQGDVYRVACERPFAIGIIDGYFEHVPAVWHKEILWAISQGVHVLGSSSMGALRAAELNHFGMRGVGRIYAAFRTGELEDDDEVAVAHGDASVQYRGASEAMVNIRATLKAALDKSIIGDASHNALLGVGKRLFYPDRTYPKVLELAAEAGVAATEIESFRRFLEKRRVDQKRADGLELLGELKALRAEGRGPPEANFFFTATDRWVRLVEWAATQPPLGVAGDVVPDEWIAAEARLDAGADALVAGGIARAAASHLAWRARSGGAAAPADRLGQSDSDMKWLYELLGPTVSRGVADEARATGDYARLEARARHKRDVLSAHGLLEPTLADGGLSAAELLAWYRERGRRADIAGAYRSARIVDFAERGIVQREALRELLYVRLRSVRANSHAESGQHGDS